MNNIKNILSNINYKGEKYQFAMANHITFRFNDRLNPFRH